MCIAGVACVVAATCAVVASATGASDADPLVVAPAPARVVATLQAAVTDASLPSDLRVEVECRRHDRMQSVLLYGTHVGVWNGSAQFALDDRTLRQALRAYVRARFVGMPQSFGDDPNKGSERSLRVTCSVLLTVEDEQKRVVQLAEGPQSKALRTLAETLLAIGESRSQRFVRALDLSDALDKIASGRLAPELLTIVAHQPPERGHDDGWLLRLEHAVVETRRYADRDELGEPSRVRLSPAAIRRLAAGLSTARAAAIPTNVNAGRYTDLAVSILAFEHHIQARQFASQTVSASEHLARVEELVSDLMRGR